MGKTTEKSKSVSRKKVLPLYKEYSSSEDSDDSLHDPDFNPTETASKDNNEDFLKSKRGRGRPSKFSRIKPKKTSTPKIITSKKEKMGGNKRKTATKSTVPEKKLKESDKSSKGASSSKPAGQSTSSSTASKPDDPLVTSSSDSAVDFQPGDFIVEKEKLKTGDYALWKVKTGCLIHKYEKVDDENDNDLYQNVMSYSNLLKAHYERYTKVLVRIMYKYRGEEKIKVLEIPFLKEEANSSQDKKKKKKTSVEPSATSTPKVEKKIIPEISSTTSSSKAEFQPGEYVLDKIDEYNEDSFSIWKIENGRLLKKYEAFNKNGKLLHKALKVFRGYKEIGEQYLPVQVKVVPDTGTEKVVEVLEVYKPNTDVKKGLEKEKVVKKNSKSEENKEVENLKLEEDKEAEGDPLLQMYHMVIQIFLSQALDSGFLKEISLCSDKTYTEPLNTVERLLDQKRISIDRKLRWTRKFKTSIQTCPYIREVTKVKPEMKCEVCPDSKETVQMVIYLYGRPYDSLTLKEHKGPLVKSQNLEYNLGKTPASIVNSYHQICHFRYYLYDRCQAKINSVKEEGQKTKVEDILDECLSNRQWVLKMFKEFRSLLDKT